MNNDYTGKEHAVFFRHLRVGVEEAISLQKHFLSAIDNDESTAEWQQWHESTEPALRGAASVTFAANVEWLAGKKNGKSWDVPDGWYGKEEFKIVGIIRHCWTHAAGGVLPNRKQELRTYIQRLKGSELVDRNGNVVSPHFRITADKVILEYCGLERSRVLCTRVSKTLGIL